VCGGGEGKEDEKKEKEEKKNVPGRADHACVYVY
jgi:hypothetical protein